MEPVKQDGYVKEVLDIIKAQLEILKVLGAPYYIVATEPGHVCKMTQMQQKDGTQE